MTIREARQRKGWTQVQLAAASGVDQTTISNIEVGRTGDPRFAIVMALAKALGVRPEGLRFGRTSRKSETKESVT